MKLLSKIILAFLILASPIILLFIGSQLKSYLLKREFDKNIVTYAGAEQIADQTGATSSSGMNPIPTTWAGYYRINNKVSASSVEDFYADSLKEKGWTLVLSAAGSPEFQRGKETIKIYLSCADGPNGGTSVPTSGKCADVGGLPSSQRIYYLEAIIHYSNRSF